MVWVLVEVSTDDTKQGMESCKQQLSKPASRLWWAFHHRSEFSSGVWTDCSKDDASVLEAEARLPLLLDSNSPLFWLSPSPPEGFLPFFFCKMYTIKKIQTAIQHMTMCVVTPGGTMLVDSVTGSLLRACSFCCCSSNSFSCASLLASSLIALTCNLGLNWTCTLTL